MLERLKVTEEGSRGWSHSQHHQLNVGEFEQPRANEDRTADAVVHEVRKNQSLVTEQQHQQYLAGSPYGISD